MTDHRLDPSALASLGNLSLKARYIAEGALTGLHRGQYHGSSVEFAEHKEYSPGDAVRDIDWKAYGKFDRYYVKRYERETQLTAHLCIDASASMGFASGGALSDLADADGTPVSKLSYAVHMMAALAYLLIGQRDRVGLMIFGDGRHASEYLPARSRPNHAAELFGALERILELGAGGETSAAQALERLASREQRQRSLVILASDLFSDDTRALKVLQLLRARGHDPVLFHVLDPYELSLPYSGLTRFRGLEGGRELLVDPDQLRKHYLARLQTFLDKVERSCNDNGVEYHRIATDTAMERALLEFSIVRNRLASKRRSWAF